MLRILTPLKTTTPIFKNLDSGVFNGTTTHLNLGSPSNLAFNGGSPFSITFWVKWDGSSGTSLLNNLTGGFTGVAIGTDGTGLPNIYVAQAYPSNALGVYSNTPLLNIGVWTFVAITYDGSKNVTGLKQYKNAALLTSGTIVNTFSGNSTSNSPWIVGTPASASFFQTFKGSMDEIAFWSAELSPGALTALYNAGTPTNLASDPHQANLISWYRFEPELTPPDTTSTIYDRVDGNNAAATDLTLAADVPT